MTPGDYSMSSETTLPVPSSHPTGWRLPAAHVLRRASGYLELGELLVDGESPPPATACRLLERALDELGQLTADERQAGNASLVAGEALRALGRWQAALEPLSRAAEGRGHREAWLGIGWCQKRLGRLDLAIAALRKGLAAFPNEALLLYNLACYHSLAGDVPAAVEHLTRAIAIDARFRDLTGAEHDFDSIREDPRFVAVTTVIV
jgi:tetratricopeptide (TPR) repeat protein